MMDAREQQAEDEGHAPHELVKEYRDSQLNKAKGKMNITNLRALDWINEDKFPFFDLLVSQKALGKNARKSYTKKTIKETYENYFKAILDLSQTEDAEEYISTLCMLRKFETAYMPMVALCLALCVAKGDFQTMEDALSKTPPWWQRYMLFSSSSINGQENGFYDVCCYSTLMSAANEKDMKKWQSCRDTYIIKRAILQDMLSFFRGHRAQIFLDTELGSSEMPENSAKSIPIKIDIQVLEKMSRDVIILDKHLSLMYPEWTDADYHDAVQFFKTEYRYIEDHISFVLPTPSSWSATVYENIRSFYEPLLAESLREFRQFRKRAKQRKSQKSKSWKCPYCGDKTEQVKHGKAHGKQRYRCKVCGKTYTAKTKTTEDRKFIKLKIIELYKKKCSLRTIQNKTGIPKSTVARWIREESKSSE